jgi:hypothetical protein
MTADSAAFPEPGEEKSLLVGYLREYKSYYPPPPGLDVSPDLLWKIAETALDAQDIAPDRPPTSQAPSPEPDGPELDVQESEIRPGSEPFDEEEFVETVAAGLIEIFAEEPDLADLTVDEIVDDLMDFFNQH